MIIKKLPLDKLKPAPYNPRVDLQPGDPAYEKLKRSILEFEYVDPMIWNKRTGHIVGGHQRLKILKELGFKEIEVSVVDLSLKREMALNSALNEIEGERDPFKLAFVLNELEAAGIDSTLTGIDRNEIEIIKAQHEIKDVGDLLKQIDLSLAIEKPIWIVIRTSEDHLGLIENYLKQLEEQNIKIQRSYQKNEMVAE